MSRYVDHVFVMHARVHTHNARGNDHCRIKYVHIQWVMIVNVIICVRMRHGLFFFWPYATYGEAEGGQEKHG